MLTCARQPKRRELSITKVCGDPLAQGRPTPDTIALVIQTATKKGAFPAEFVRHLSDSNGWVYGTVKANTLLLPVDPDEL